MPGEADRTGEEKLIALFRSTNEAMKAESVLKEAHLPITLRPVPKHISSDCGVCVEFPPDVRENVVLVLKENKIQFFEITPI